VLVEAFDFVRCEGCRFFQQGLGKEVEALGEHFFALLRQREEEVRPSGMALDLLGTDQAITLEAREVLPGGHGCNVQRPRGFLNSDGAGALEQDEYLMLGGLHRSATTPNQL